MNLLTGFDLLDVRLAELTVKAKSPPVDILAPQHWIVIALVPPLELTVEARVFTKFG